MLPDHSSLVPTWWGCCGSSQIYKPTELARSFLFCSCVCFSPYALLTVFHSINSPDNSPFSHSVVSVLLLPYWSFQLKISLYKSLPQPWYNPSWLTGLKPKRTNSLTNHSSLFQMAVDVRWNARLAQPPSGAEPSAARIHPRTAKCERCIPR